MRAALTRLPMALVLAASTVVSATSASASTSPPAAPAGTVIDSFDTALALSSPAGGTATAFALGSGLLGGARTSVLTTTGGSATLATATVDDVPVLTVASGPTTNTHVELRYDGSATPAFDAGGLGSVDFTDGGTDTAVVAPAASDTAGGSASLTLWTDAQHCSTGTVPLPVAARPGLGSQAVAWRFAGLSTAAGCAGPADPTRIGAAVIGIGLPPGATAGLRAVTTGRLDWGDLPAAWGDTTAAENGAAAVAIPGLLLGRVAGSEADGQHSAGSSADPSDDGVRPTPGVTWSSGSPTDTPSAGGALDVTVAGSGCLGVWLGLAPGTDLAAPGDLVALQPVVSGTTTVHFPLPTGFALPATLVARTRLAPRDLDGGCTDGLAPTGVSSGGEVEDYVLTVTAPPAPPTFLSVPASPSASRAPTWTFTQALGMSDACTLLDAQQAVVQPAVPCSGSWTPRLPDADGAYTVAVVATDTQGRSSAAADSTVVLDTTPPAAPVVLSGPHSPTSTDGPAWTFTGPPDGSTRCRLSTVGSAGVAVLDDWASCTSPATFSLARLPDGPYTFAVEATDAAGNTSAVVTSTVTRDTTPPSLPHFTATPPGVSSLRTPSWAFATDPDASAQCQLRSGQTAQTTSGWSDCASPYVASLVGRADGAWTLAVRGIDAAGNAGPAATSTVTLDTVAPVVTVLAAPVSPLSSSVLRWTVVTDDPAATLTCSLVGASGTVAARAPCPPATPAGTPVTYDVSGHPDGGYELAVQATDAAGNLGATVTSDVVVDRTPPAQPQVGQPDSPRRDPSLTWTLEGDPTAVLYCALNGPDGSAGPPAPCTSPVSYDLSQRPDGTYTLAVTARDQAGNDSQAATSSVVLDRTPPGLGITGSPAAPSVNRAPSWSFQTDAGAQAQCRVDGPDGNVVPFQPCESPFTVHLTDRPDGVYVFSVRARDAAGNVAGPERSSFLLDTTAPVGPTVLTAPQSPSNSRTPAWTFAAEPGAAVSCRLLSGDADALGNGRQLQGWSPCAGSYTANLGGIPDGLVTFQVRATDAAGNVSVASSAGFVLDTIATAPLIATAPPSPANLRLVSWTFALAPDESARCRLTLGTTVVTAFAPCASPVWEDFRGQADGTYDLQVQAADLAGNVSGVTDSGYLLDTTAPAAPQFGSGPASPGSSRSPSWTFTTDADALTTCRTVSGTLALTSWLPCAGRATAALTGLGDGTYATEVRATDNAGNTSVSSRSSDYELLTTPPAAPVISSAPGAGGAATTLSWRVTAPGGSSSSCQLTEAAVTVAGWSPCAGTVSYDVSGTGDGVLLFSARAVDAVQVTGPTAVSAFVLDRTPPGPPVITDGPGRSGPAGVVRWAFSADPGADSTCQLSRVTGELVSDWVPCTSSFAVDLTARGTGDYLFRVRAADTWGNTTTATRYRYTYTAPVVPPPNQQLQQGPPQGTLTGDRGKAVRVTVVLPAITENRSRPVHTVVVHAKPSTGRATGRGPPVRVSRPTAAPVAPRTGTRKASPPAGARGFTHGPIGRAITSVLGATRDHVAVPLVLILLVLLFLGLQDRLDRNDPKLALPMGRSTNDFAEFR